MSEHETRNETDESLTNIADAVQNVQDAVEELEDDVSIDLFKRLDNLEDAVEHVEDWADDAEDDEDLAAVAGVKTIVDAEQERAELLREKAPSGRGELLRKFEDLEDALEDLEDLVDPLTFDTTAYVVYVNHEFVGRYTDEDVTVERLLHDAGKEDPDELGLFPLDGFRGERQTDQAFPADRDLDLGDEHRAFFESTSDGGNIA